MTIARGALVVLIALVSGAGAALGRTATWNGAARELEDGTSQGVATTARGVLFPAPRLARVGETRLPTGPGQVWALAADSTGALFVGTGPDGNVLRSSTAGKWSVHFHTPEPLVTALAFAKDGALLAGTAPGGRIYRIPREGEGSVWCETGERYVWALAAAPDGTVYAGTGERGLVLRIGPTGTAETLFDGDDTHIVSLQLASGGALLSGGAGRGLAHRIGASGDARVLFQRELPEVVGLGSEADGSVVAALAGEPEREYQPPAVMIQLPDGTRVGQTDEAMGSLHDDEGPILRGFIEGLPRPGGMASDETRGAVVRVRADGRSETLWESQSSTPFCLLPDAGGRTWFGTGEPARLYRVDATGDVALLATLPEAQITRMIRTASATFVATSNPAAVYRIEGPQRDASIFVSRPLDAGGVARWGVLRWTAEGPGRAEFATRSGNSREPDDTWSAWGSPLVEASGSPVPSPEGRYLQWRVKFPATQDEGARVRDVNLRYEPYNRPPQVRGFRLDGPDWIVSTSATFRWESLDPDGDPVRLVLEYRASASADWSPAVWEPQPATSDERITWRDDRRAWDTSKVPEGRYEVRAVASDAAGNPPDAAASVPVGTPHALIVDRTPPRIEWQEVGADRLRISVRDDQSEVRRLEWVVNGEVRASLRAQDGVCDSSVETFEMARPPDSPASVLRATDAAGNRAEAGIPGKP
jgi:hypothetical protein